MMWEPREKFALFYVMLTLSSWCKDFRYLIGLIISDTFPNILPSVRSIRGVPPVKILIHNSGALPHMVPS